MKKEKRKKKLQRKKNKTKNRIELDNSLIYWPGLNPHFFQKKNLLIYIAFRFIFTIEARQIR